mgnify:CR=1 FL=1
MNFGEKVRNFRTENDYTQDEFAKLIGVSKRTLLLYEQGKRYPKQKEVYEKIGSIDEINEVEVELTFDPPWGQEMMSEEAKLELGFL